MKSHRLRALALLFSVGLSACGGGGGGGVPAAPANTAPTANFSYVCADLTCTFTNSSTDQDVGDVLSTDSWSFGDASTGATTINTVHTYAASGSYDVTLTSTDRAGAKGTVVKKVQVTAPPPPAAPHSTFVVSCVSLDCTFTDTSTYDTGSVFQSRAWDFGDSSAASTASPATHAYTFTTLTPVSVRLSITDAAGKVSTSTQSIAVTPPATSLNCSGGGNCVLKLTQNATVTATMLSTSCGAGGNQVVLTSPVAETVFANGCFTPAGTAVALKGGGQFVANTTLEFAVRSGVSGTSGLVFPPAIRVSGDFASGWTLVFDDGFGGSGEPDFNDLVILIKANP